MTKHPESSRSADKDETENATGISNRRSVQEEHAERAAYPPAEAGSPPPEDAAGRVGDQPIDYSGLQTAHKAGSRSIAQKEAASRYPDRSMPASRKVAGAFGKEPAPSIDRTEPE